MLLNDLNECVSPDQCPGACPDGEVFTECSTSCPLICNELGFGPSACTTVCVRGCFCRDGLYRNSRNECVPLGQCPPPPPMTPSPLPSVCPDGEVFTKCGTACPLRCDKIGSEPYACPAICVVGCFCPDGLYRNARNECVPQDQCPSPPKCPNGSVYDTCGTACPLTCDSPHPRICTRQCVRGCFCPTGMLQRNTTCVTPDECNMCHYNGRTYRKGEGFNSTDGCNRCICLEGHVACTRKACPVLPPLLCPNGKEYRECGTACPQTCQKGPLICTLQCVRGCFCPRGLVEHNGQCIKPSKCPRQETPCDQLRNNQTTTCHGLIGCFVTSCEPDGSFSSQQCHPSTGYCYCVDDSGNKLEGTDTAPYLVSTLDCTKPVVAVSTFAQAKPTPSPSICPMNKTFGCGSACPLTCSYPSVRVCTKECVFDCNCPRGLLDVGDVCVTQNSCSGLSSGCELVKGKKELIYFNGCRSVRRVVIPKCMGQCTVEGSRARCRATNGLKQQMMAFRCKPKEKGAKKYTTTMPIAVAESCSCSVV
ncbi:SCO-spondin-like [Corticium candelabrum]|uniref:SCO-spondin-like n=1 Tax=Corticium candelabrum TaxID=121492 RepID=UPI002E276349|nr:SCO-spondin-like [Corticium candelabrum]